MSLQRLHIQHLRILSSLKISPSPTLNIFVGQNASGKTSILEAIHFLATARSFRTALLTDLVRGGEAILRVTGAVSSTRGVINLGVEKSRDGLQMRAAGQKIHRVSDLASWLPVLVIHPDSHLLMSGGPKHRRRFLDWGLFHVEPSFFPVWQRYDRALKQRNAALKHYRSDGVDSAWDKELSESAKYINELRNNYLFDLAKLLPAFTQALAGSHDFTMTYDAGWDTNLPLVDVFQQTLARDKQRGFTCSGPHRADLVFRLDGRRAQQYVSRGQEKILVIALMLAQAELLNRRTGRTSLILLDDFAAELDFDHQQRLLEILRAMNTQLFITMIDCSHLRLDAWQNRKMFHVEQGQLAEML